MNTVIYRLAKRTEARNDVHGKVVMLHGLIQNREQSELGDENWNPSSHVMQEGGSCSGDLTWQSFIF